ncbi:heat shock protein Hsp20 [Hypnocyclicus thermotrophus]|uniref:Heat shock protein Hsp20 n=1 Tax=Hypnocyclicus thermotrophus TaxID=1627895 RepID=A0AA46E0F6_9FUSO|nr:Hsp20/alpha crystallin family protein [Hypnocyclicus thermotrophus]TDT72016.1 heat shock protein Hsp20 [Hypnocyclicus thermotrophus]
MRNLITTKKWNPFLREKDYFDSIFDSFDSFFGSPSLFSDNFQKFSTDISETDNAYIISADLPGVKKEDVKLELHEGYLKISAERKEEKEEKNKKFFRKERIYGSFVRNIPLPNYLNITKEEIEAKFENGVLNVTIPKKLDENNQKQYQTIEIK